MQIADSTLYRFLNDPSNSHAKEAILMHRLYFDLKVVAAARGYYLNTYWDDVDHDGFDLIFDDQDSLMKTQVKSVGAAAATNIWNIHKRILRPTFYQIDKLGFEASPQGEGVAGGVVLIRYRVEDDGRLEVDYLYTDLYVLLAFENGLIQRGHGSSRNAIKTCLQQLREGLGSERLAVPRAAFVRAKSPAALLALLGLHGTLDHTWKIDVTRVVNKVAGDGKMIQSEPLENLKKRFWTDFSLLVDDSELNGSTIV
jgi:hypothetical protein